MLDILIKAIQNNQTETFILAAIKKSIKKSLEMNFETTSFFVG